jgi:HSP20 family protein
VGRTPSSVEVFAFAPGIDASSLDVTIERNVLKISGTRVVGRPDRDAKVQLYANERRKAASRVPSRFPTTSTP